MNLNANVQGIGESVILIHGLFGSLSNLNMLTKSLSEYFTVHRLDVRNHGESPHLHAMDYPTMANDILSYMDSQGIVSTNLIGHSMGGKIAMQLAMNHSQRINSLVVVDIAPVTYKNRHDDIIKALSSINLEKIKTIKDADDLLSSDIPEKNIRSFLLQNLVKRSAGFKWRINLKAIESEYPNIVLAPTGSTFDGPTLFLKGNESDYIQAKHKNAIDAFFPNCHLKIIEDTSHWLHAEKPGLFKRIVMNFLLENR
ncbi:alpha/beta fold hydrolase [Cocleimonas flava]|uniref:Esterase n=1 Tax=Cocleimonas flava TaxID=634765 RepID=A0A4R1ETK4_9GAMM|nr:alpha/beta fold hydrolase [Cocleimonas flava]TCJ83079.1 esterase [Cocleimonas flava]